MTKPIARDPIYRQRAFDADVIQLCVRWYVTYRLSYRDLVEMMAQRGIKVAHSTILRWVTRYIPEFEKRWKRIAKTVGTSWRVDETYVKIKAKWHYLYRAVDQYGKTVDFLLRRDRGIAAAQAFFRKALVSTLPRVPRKVTLDGHVPSRSALWRLRREHPCWRSVRGADEQVPQQSDRARPPGDQTTMRLDSRVQVVRERGHHDCRNRACPPHS
jgi:transposase-like protein